MSMYMYASERERLCCTQLRRSKAQNNCHTHKHTHKHTHTHRGLFEKDKLVFSFMLCGEIMRQAGLISDTEWNLFLRGTSGVEKVCTYNYSSNQ